MVRDITWGQYHSCDSIIHRLDPRAKIRFTIIYIILLLPDRNLFLFLFLTGVFLAALFLSRVPVRKLFSGSLGIFLFILLCSALNIFTVRGTVLAHFLGLTLTREGLIKFGFVFWRMALLIFMSGMLMYTTTPTALVDGLEKCFHLSKNVAMGITIALRFLPILFEELDRIVKAQEARGTNFHQGSPAARLGKLKNVIVPLIQNAVRRAENLGLAMDARCYVGGKGRTKLNPLVYRGRDVVCYLVLTAVLAVSIVLIVMF